MKVRDIKNIFPPKAYSRIVLCVVLFFCMLLCYNGLWNMALYPAEARYIDTLGSFIDACMMLTTATLIATSFGALSVLELVCTAPDNEWKTITQMILWSLLTILMNSFMAYMISTGNNSGVGMWLILITTTVISIVWYISTIILLKSSKRLLELHKKLEEDDELDENEEDMNSKNLNTKELVYKVLREMGCTPQETEKGMIKFEYQSVSFLIEAAVDCMFVNIVWPWCYYFSKFDIDELARVRQVINIINGHGEVSMFYLEADSDEIAVIVKKNLLFVQQIPELDNYLRLIINNFFEAVRTLELEVERKKILESGSKY